VRTTQNLLFHYFATWLLPLSIFILGFAIPILVTRDLASNAITIYASKAVSRGDYFLGKFATAFGLLALTWLGPLCAAWCLGNLLAPDWRFFWHARAALAHTLLFVLLGMTILSLLALGVSATSTKEKSTPVFWFLWWIIGGVIARLPRTPNPGSATSVSSSTSTNSPSPYSARAGHCHRRDHLPILGDLLRSIRPETMSA